VYFDYIQAWMSGLQQLPEVSKRLKNFLEEEWNFTKEVCLHVRRGEANAGNRFWYITVLIAIFVCRHSSRVNLENNACN